MKNKKSKIEIFVELDENKIPEKIHWSASDAGIKIVKLKLRFYLCGIQIEKKV